jgi:hypothetical protein
MLIHDTLDRLADMYIPSGIHKYLHVNSREAWVDTIVSLYERGKIDPNPEVMQSLLKRWEILLYKKYSQLN